MSTKALEASAKGLFVFICHPLEDLSLFIARHPEFELCLTKNNSGPGVALLFPKYREKQNSPKYITFLTFS